MVFASSHLSFSGVEFAGQLHRCEQLQFEILLRGEVSALLASMNKTDLSLDLVWALQMYQHTAA